MGQLLNPEHWHMDTFAAGVVSGVADESLDFNPGVPKSIPGFISLWDETLKK